MKYIITIDMPYNNDDIENIVSNIINDLQYKLASNNIDVNDIFYTKTNQLHKIKDYKLFIKTIHELIENNNSKTIEDIKNIKELKDFNFYDYKMDIDSNYTNFTIAYKDINESYNAYMVITKDINYKIIYKDGDKIDLKKFHSTIGYK